MRQAVLVGERGQIVRMRGVHHETNQRAALVRMARARASRAILPSAPSRSRPDRRVVLENRRAPDSLDVIDGCAEPDRAGDVRRAGFEAVRRFLERAFFEGDADDHLAAAVPRRHRIEQLRASVEHADPGRSAHFVSGEGEEIAAQFLHIDRQCARRSARHRPA